MNAAACDGALKCTFARTVPSAATVTVMFGYALPCADCERAILDDHLHVQWRPFSVEIIGAFGNALDVCILLMVFRGVVEDFALGFRAHFRVDLVTFE